MVGNNKNTLTYGLIIGALQADPHHGASYNIEIAKGLYRYPRTIKEALGKIKRLLSKDFLKLYKARKNGKEI